MRVAGVSGRLLQTRSTQLLEAEAEAEGRGVVLVPPRASAGLHVLHTAALLARSLGLTLEQSLAFSVTLFHHLEEEVAVYQKLFGVSFPDAAICKRMFFIFLCSSSMRQINNVTSMEKCAQEKYSICGTIFNVNSSTIASLYPDISGEAVAQWQ